MSRFEQFHAFRNRLNARILGDAEQRGASPDAPPRPGGTVVTKRFFRLDGQAYEPGALDEKTKEMLGLVASLVLRCDDCVAYHIDRAVTLGVTDAELWEVLDIALIVGGSIVIPHLRRGIDFLDECRAAQEQNRPPSPPAAGPSHPTH